MHFKKSGVIIALSWFLGMGPLLGQATLQIQTQDGSTLTLPPRFDQILQPDIQSSKETIIGLHSPSQVRVVYVHSNEKIPFQPEKILAEALELDRVHLEPVTMDYAQGIHRNPIHRIISTGGYNQLFLAYDKRYYHGGGSFFFLLGTNREFFEFVPQFEYMVDQFNPGKPQFKKGIADIPIWIILVAIFALCVNMWFIFMGFKEMARMQS